MPPDHEIKITDEQNRRLFHFIQRVQQPLDDSGKIYELRMSIYKLQNLSYDSYVTPGACCQL